MNIFSIFRKKQACKQIQPDIELINKQRAEFQAIKTIIDTKIDELNTELCAIDNLKNKKNALYQISKYIVDTVYYIRFKKDHYDPYDITIAESTAKDFEKNLILRYRQYLINRSGIDPEVFDIFSKIPIEVIQYMYFYHYSIRECTRLHEGKLWEKSDEYYYYLGRFKSENILILLDLGFKPIDGITRKYC